MELSEKCVELAKRRREDTLHIRARYLNSINNRTWHIQIY